MNAIAHGRALLQQVHDRAYLRLMPPRRRSHREFAEQEIVIPNGPRAGLPFRVAYRPWTGDVLDEFSRGRYWRFFGSGPTQDGKTLLFYVIPALYHLFELEQDIILGAPAAEMAQAAYRQRLLPTIVASKYRDLLPRTGTGSRGGNKAPEIVFRNGRSIRFVGAGGGDAQRSGWTAPAIFMTELDKMDDAGAASDEADPVTQMEARASAFMESGMARIYGECTMSTEDGLVHREVSEIGTDTRVLLPCAKCGEYIFPERKDFTGWSGTPNIEEAARRATFICPNCRHPWTEEDRRKSLEAPRLAARGQKVLRDGTVEGPTPETNTFGLRWNAMASPFKRQGDVGMAEWRAELTDKEVDKKAVVQFWWAEPWKPEALALTDLTREIVERKVSGYLRGAIPSGALRVTVSIDLGAHRCWWVAIAWMPDGRGHVIDYGALDVPKTGDAEAAAILTTLREFRDETLKAGWAAEGGPRGADLVLIDSGYHPDAAYPFVLESGQGAFAATKGFGSAYRAGGWTAPPKSAAAGMAGDDWWVSPQPGGILLVNLHADYWKGVVHDAFAAAVGKPGALTLFRAERVEHAAFARQITGEKRIPEDDPKKALRFRWHRTRSNHYLDCVAMGRAGADMLGIKPHPVGAPAEAGGSGGGDDKRTDGGGRGWLRSRY